MGISINTALEKEIISKEIFNIIPRKCKCGRNLEFSDSLRSLKCTSQKCKYSLIGRIYNFNKALNLNINEIDIEYLIDNLNITTPYQLLMLTDILNKDDIRLKNSNIHNNKDLIQKLELIKQNEYLLYEVVEFCGISNISKIAYKIFNGFDNIDEAFNEIESGQVTFINERLGIKNQDSSILSLEIYNELIDLKEELIFAEYIFNIKQENKQKLNIAFNDNILPFINVDELIDWLNYTYNYRFNHVSTISNTTDILIKGAESSSSKYRIAKLINDKHIADLMNQGSLSLDDIGKFNNTDLKPQGSVIFIDTLDNIINRLNKCK